MSVSRQWTDLPLSVAHFLGFGRQKTGRANARPRPIDGTPEEQSERLQRRAAKMAAIAATKAERERWTQVFATENALANPAQAAALCAANIKLETVLDCLSVAKGRRGPSLSERMAAVRNPRLGPAPLPLSESQKASASWDVAMAAVTKENENARRS